MEKKELDLARSIITSALTPNNKTGMTAAELDEEIYALMGERLKLPPGCPGLEAFIQRFFNDEIIGTPHYGGVLKYRLIPKADTDYLLKLVARQNDKGSKPLYVAEKAREAAIRSRGMGRASRSGRGGRGSSRPSARGSSRGGGAAGNPFSRLGPPIPPRLQISANSNSFVNDSYRSSSSLDWIPPTPAAPPPLFQNGSATPAHSINVSALQKAVQQAMSDTRRPVSAMAQTATTTPLQTPSEGWSKKFKDVFDRYKTCKESGLSMEISCRLTHSKTKLAATDFPSTVEELCSLLSVVVSQCENQPKPLISQPGEVPLAPNAFPPIGRKFFGTIERLDTFERFMVQTETPSGKRVIIPCSLYGATVTDVSQAVKVAKEAISSCDNMVNVLVKGHKPTHVEVDLYHAGNGASLVSYLASKCLIFAKPESFVATPSTKDINDAFAKLFFKLNPVLPSTDQFIARVSAVMMASLIAVNIKANVPILIEIENALSANVNTKSKVRPDEVVKGACFVVRTSQFCRARVFTAAETNSNEIRLRLIDHGSDVTCSSLNELHHVPNVPVVVDTPPLAFYLDLHNLQHHFFQKESCTVIAERHLLGKTYEVRVIDRSGKRPQANLFEINPSTGYILDPSTAVNKKVKDEILKEMSPNLEIGQFCPIVVRYIDWDNERGDIRLHAQILGFGLELLETVEQALPSYYETGSTSKAVSKDQLSMDQEYAAPYQGCFYRCNLMSTDVDAKGRVLVLFYDYGNVESVPITDLRVLEEKYSSEVLSNQAISTRLSGLPPPGKQWVSNASDLVFSTFDGEGEYLAKAISFDPEERCFEVEFKLRNGESVNEKFTKMSELFEDQKSGGDLLVADADTGSLSGSDMGRSSDTSTLINNSGDKFSNAVTSLPSFTIEKSFDEKDSSINACVISLNSASSLCCQLVPNDEFNEMITQMNDFYSKAENLISPLAPLKVGDVGIASAGGCYCRAQVQSVGKYSYRVNFVDYATSNQIIKQDSMYLLEARFANIQPMGFELKLVNIPQPKSNYCPPSINEYSDQLAEENPYIKVYPAEKFTSDDPCDAIVSVVGHAIAIDTGVDINAHIAMLLQ